MNFETQLPEWQNEGTEPNDDLKTNGFKEGYKPPAGIFNWFWSLILKAIKEIQNSLSNVDNTKDSEKSVKFASEAGIGRKLKYALTVRFKGGQTEGTDLWTFDGSTSRSINITPDKIGAANKDEVIKIVDAVTEDGATYTVTAPDITELKNGMELTIIPSANNTNLSPRLAINSLGDKAIRIGHSFNYAATNALKTNYLQAGRPVKLKYDANCNLGTQGQGAWIFTDKQKTSAQDLYGNVPIESGGTGADTAEGALENLGVADYIIERAVDGMWTYEKWASGKAVCWGDYYEEDVVITDIWQDGWYYRDFQSHSYPENLFLDGTYPMCQLGYEGVGQTTLCSKSPYLESEGVTRLTPQIRLLMITNDPVQRLRLTYYAIGRWK